MGAEAPGSIQRRVQTVSFDFKQNRLGKALLREGFATTDSEAAISDKRFIPHHLFHDLLSCNDLAVLEMLGIRVVAVEAAQGTSGKKHYESNSGTINGPTGFE